MKTNAFVKLVTVMAVSLGLATAACSGGEPEYMGSCMLKFEGSLSCTDYFGEDNRGGAEMVCKEFAKPTHFGTSKLLTERCPAQGKQETFVTEHEGYDAREVKSNYVNDIKYMEAAK